MSKKKMTGAEIMEQDKKDFEADVKAMMEEAAPKTPLAAAIDRATGFKPEDMVKSATLKKKEEADPGTEEADPETEKPETGTKRRDWVEEAYKCFIKDAGDIDPTDPVKAIEAYFQKNATDELKARCKAEGKDAKGCWRFIEAVARKALHGSSGHIDPGVVYAIAMHWFEDVPVDWDSARPQGARRQVAGTAKPKKPTTRKERLEERAAHGSSKAKAELRGLKKKERAKAKAKASASAAKPLRRDKKRPKQSQGFFFEMLETPAAGGEERGDVSPRAGQESEVQG